jgi:hypothetical protein
MTYFINIVKVEFNMIILLFEWIAGKFKAIQNLFNLSWCRLVFEFNIIILDWSKGFSKYVMYAYEEQ